MDLAAPLVSDIVWPEIANALSKIARFNGGTRGVAYSVAQHCVMGADALYAETGSQIAAAYFLLHDAHEGKLGDMIRPRLQLIEHHAGRRSGIRLADQAGKAALDEVIYQAARIIPLAYADCRETVELMDERMWVAEALALLGPAARASIEQHWPEALAHPAPRLAGAIRPWGAMKAEEAWLDRLGRFLGINARDA